MLITALLLALYFIVPLNNVNNPRSWLLLVGAICVFGVVTAWEYRRICGRGTRCNRLSKRSHRPAALPARILGVTHFGGCDTRRGRRGWKPDNAVRRCGMTKRIERCRQSISAMGCRTGPP
ncbi:hypothetical protein MPY17_34090 [Rhodococcus opacus]|uniref:hypothetical protein n=1 Tax=Rhodococcus opacus TaxID=37919 RepID=UPI001FF6CB3E|nr:hypothetical protein [Rhodococcus opacus]UOT03870.1 hypothetical protein MPY17_34090 [Rhodococcus opacus]